MGKPVVHFEINTRDHEKVQDFYAGVFEWEVDASNPIGYGLVRTHAGRGIDGGIGGLPEGTDGNLLTFYIEVDDVQAYLDRVVAAGAETVMPVTEVPGMVTFAQFRDPGGNVVGLVKAEPGS